MTGDCGSPILFVNQCRCVKNRTQEDSSLVECRLGGAQATKKGTYCCLIRRWSEVLMEAHQNQHGRFSFL